MGRPERPLDPDSGPVAALAMQMRDLRRSAGGISYREMAQRAGFSPSVLSAAAGGFRLPTLHVTLAFAEACGGDRDEWERRWRKAARACRPASGGRSSPGRTGAAQTVGTARPTELPRPPKGGMLPTPAQLPSGSGRFSGRRRELAWLDRMARPSGDAAAAPILVTGPVGIGKSALAARWCRLNQDRYPGGVLYADLSDYGRAQASPNDVLADFLCILNVPSERIPSSLGQRAALYRSILAERGVLVLLDNAISEDQVCPLLAEAPGSQTIVTARRRLTGLDGVERLTLDRLSHDESLAMIAAIVGRENVACHRKHAVEISEICDHLPLALRSIATRTAVRSGWTLMHAAERLRDESSRLSQFSSGEYDLRARLSRTIFALDGFTRQTFLHLAGLKRSAVEVGAVARLLGTPAHAVEEALEALVDSGLTQTTTTAGKYRLPSLFALCVREETATAVACEAKPTRVIEPLTSGRSADRRTLLCKPA